MREQIRTGAVVKERDHARQYEYLILTVSPNESLPAVRQAVREHAEYGKWELERSVLYMGGGRKYWLRRRVLRVERTA
jgi:hypothetical protein